MTLRVAVLLSLAALVTLSPAQSIPDQPDPTTLLRDLNAHFARLAPQTIRPADGYIKHPYLVPSGYYPQMWDWDGFFIGLHFANQNPSDAAYLRDWVLSFAGSADAEGYVAGCITPKGPRPLFGKFAMKPFLAQGALVASRDLNDYAWLRPIWPAMKLIIDYRRRTQFDPKWGQWFWDNAMQSGADNNPALTNDEHDRSAILAVDASVWAMREYQAMAILAQHLDDTVSARVYAADEVATRDAIRRQLYSPRDAMFWNRRRDTGEVVRVIAWSNFLPLLDGFLSRGEARRMIQLYLVNPAQMRSPPGFRSLSSFDRNYNNEAIINPYSNWRGPIWINANFLDWIVLRRYGFNNEARWLAIALAEDIHRDIERWGSMHEDYNAETGDGLAPTPEQSPNGKFAGFVGWNLLAQYMLQCELTGQHCITLTLDSAQ